MTRTPFAYTAIIRLNNGEHIRRKIAVNSTGESLLKSAAEAFMKKDADAFEVAMRDFIAWGEKTASQYFNATTIADFADVLGVEPYIEGFTFEGWQAIADEDDTNETVIFLLRFGAIDNHRCSEVIDRLAATWSDSNYEYYSQLCWHAFVRKFVNHFVKPLPF